jgi:hypothetical protein
MLTQGHILSQGMSVSLIEMLNWIYLLIVVSGLFTLFSEWIEMLRLLGVTTITVHNSTLGQAASNVLLHYEKTGFITIRQTRPLVSATDFGADIQLRSTIALSDCMYRNMYSIEHIIVIDLDEIIIPESGRDYFEMMTQINKTLDVSTYRGYQFSNVYFVLEPDIFPDAADLSQPAYSTFMRYRRRLAPSRPGWHTKSIINPRLCAFVFNHYCVYSIHQFKVNAVQVMCSCWIVFIIRCFEHNISLQKSWTFKNSTSSY